MERDDDARRRRAAERLTGRLQAMGANRPARAGHNAGAGADAPSPAPSARSPRSPEGAVAALRRSLADSAAQNQRRRPATGAHPAPAASALACRPDEGDSPELEARQAEHAERWGDAARAWARASDARPDQLALARRAALNFLKDGHLLSRGVQYAERAVQLAPTDAFSHRVLGQIYLEARMWQNARRALERALALDPQDAAVHVLIQKARRQS